MKRFIMLSMAALLSALIVTAASAQQARTLDRLGTETTVRGSITVLGNVSLADRIAKGKYDWVYGGFVKDSSINTLADYTVEYKLFHFDRDVEAGDVIRAMSKECFHPANLLELLAFGAAQPELQKQFTVVALDQGRYIPILYSAFRSATDRTLERRINKIWVDGTWATRCHFLGIHN